MSSAWAVVNPSHVEQACRLFDQKKAIPTRPPTKTFLLWNGGRYPAKFIRGLAYRLATGTDPASYSGGLETVAFFTALGFVTEHDGLVQPAHSPPVPSPPAPSAPASSTVKPLTQKDGLRRLLQARFSGVKFEAHFEWLTVPALDKMPPVLRAIHSALVTHRGHTVFASVGRRLCCDYFMPSHRLIVEYDERQHFTVPRAVALRLYPKDLRLGFDRTEWINACERVHANDPTPLYRDEQRALYDSMRDILAANNGITVIRIRDRTFDWNTPGAAENLDRIFSDHGIQPGGRS